MNRKSLKRLLRSVGCFLIACWVAWPGEAIGQVQFPLQISADGRHLEDQNGIPFLINGDTPWSLIVELSKVEAETYLEDRRARGFNAVITELIEAEFGGPANSDGELPFLAPGDFGQPNEAYFQHADWVIRKAAEKGMLVVLTPAYVGYQCGSAGWCQEMQASTPADLREFGNFVGNRYKDFDNVIWMHGGDVDAASYGADDEVDHIVDGILDVDLSKLHTAHCDRQQSALDCYDKPWLNVNTTYSDCVETAIRTRTDYERSSQMAFFFVEGRYENEGASASCLRAQAYWSVLGGSTGHFFGNRPLWFFGENWERSLDKAGSRSMTHFGALFSSRRWHLLDPDYDSSVVMGDRGTVGETDYVAAAVADDGSSVIAYLPTVRTISVDLSAVAGQQAQTWWFKPDTGIAEDAGEFATSGIVEFTPPGPGDWVLVIDSGELALGAPGNAGSPQPPAGQGPDGPAAKNDSGGGAVDPFALLVLLVLSGFRVQRVWLRL